jgi:hypothetical protein
MKHICFFVLLIQMGLSALGQITATTQNGQRVILYQDFTWDYADDFNSNNFKDGIQSIDINSEGLVHILFFVGGERIAFFDGKIHFGNVQQIKLEYHQNSFFAKTVGKIKTATFGSFRIEFEYHQNSIFEFSEGKIKSISLPSKQYNFEYYENTFFKKTVGKVKRISSGNHSVDFDYYQNSIYPETEGQLKEINGEIPGVRIRYQY